MKNKPQFLKGLTVLATMCGREVSNWEASIICEVVEPFGWERACDVLKKMMMNHETRNKFPGPGDFRKMLVPSERDDAIDVAAHMMKLVQSKGMNWSDKTKYESRVDGSSYDSFEEMFRDKVGDLAWVTVQEQYGGWSRFVEAADDENQTAFVAQLRGLIESTSKKISSGTFRVVPRLASGSERTGLTSSKDILKSMNLALPEEEKKNG